MKKVKVAFWVIILVVVVVFVYQNENFFKPKHSFIFKLPILDAFRTPELPLAILFLAFFLTGFLLAYFFSLYDRFKSRKTIKNLNAATVSQLQELATLKSELESLRSDSSGNKAASGTQRTENTA
jgi:uncharacterized integral membrane protein